MKLSRSLALPVLALSVFALAACSSSRGAGGDERSGLRLPSLPSRSVDQRPAGIGVNSFLWRASLDTISFMPLREVDPFGGVIVTDWYANPEFPSERFQVTVYILDTRLRGDALSVRVFRQERAEDGEWIDASVATQTALDIENAILTRARQLRISTLDD
ncbi:DUF3576 domain-containing protein [Hyphobacterium sp.]|uniref:DUF3576 domain-containing protein n=1 Tax=Hyphobacterium sp. TaxID=2004662 RepID=UPI003B5260EC